MWFTRHDGVVAFVVYLAISLVWYRMVVAHMGTTCACGLRADPGDGSDFVWWFEWFVHALGNGLPLFHPTVIWTPAGINLAGTTASPLLAVIAAPFTLIWGPIVAYNVLMITAPAASAWAANRLCRHITGAPGPSLLAGVTFGFSSYEIAHLIGHPQMVVMVGPPLAVLCVIRLLDGTLSSRRFVIQLTVLLIAQIFLSVEVTFTMAVVGVIALVTYAVLAAPERRRQLISRLPALALPWVLAVVASAWYLVLVLKAPSYASNDGKDFPTDVLSFVFPEPYTWLGGTSFRYVSALFPGGPTETNAYLGLPLLLILARYLITRWQTRTAKLLAVVTALITIWILGTNLIVAGKPTIKLPYSLIADLPLFTETMQGRVGAYLALVAAIVLAIWLASPRRLRLVAWACACVALASVLPNLASAGPYNVSAWTNPAFYRTSMYKHYLKRGESVLPIRWGPSSESLMWQAEDHMYWNMANGAWQFEPPAGWLSKITDDLWLNSPRPGDGPLLKNLIIRRNVADVVVGDRSLARWQQTLRGAGLRPTARVGGVVVYHVPASWLAPGGK
jgi:hypothetical protein